MEGKRWLIRLKFFAKRGIDLARCGGNQVFRLTREEGGEKDTRLEALRKQLEMRDREIEELRTKLSEVDPGSGGVKAEDVVWIFCTGRSGSTWLASMMGDLKGHAMWNEPLVGDLFGKFYYRREAHKRGSKFILGPPLRNVWLNSIRRMVLEGATARYPELSDGGYLIIKEPHGSIGAPLLMEALPESRMVLLVRDPRDVVCSAIDAQRKGSWTSKNRIWEGKKPETTADTDPDTYVIDRAKTYLRDMGRAREAYEAHEGPKGLIRYEELRAHPLRSMQRLYSSLHINVSDEELAQVIEKHAWENIPEEEKGKGKFYRKGSAGGWREDLTSEQAEAIERVTAPLLDEFYPGWRSEGRGGSQGAN